MSLSIPEDGGKASRLTTLNHPGVGITFIPQTISQLTSLTTLILPNNNISTLPVALFSCKNLTIINLAHNHLSSLNSQVSQLTHLEYLDLSYNFLTTLPRTITQLTKLMEIHLDHNEIIDLHQDLAALPLHTLTLSHNYSLCPALARLLDVDQTSKELILSFLRFRRSRELAPRFVEVQHDERRFYEDKMTQTSSWVDPRYFYFVHTLPFNLRQRLNTFDAPLPLTELRIAFEYQCHNHFCTKESNPDCLDHFCARCCCSTLCTVHSSSLLHSQHHTPEQTIEILSNRLKAVHPYESVVWVEKPRLYVTIHRENSLSHSFRALMSASPAQLRLRLNVAYINEPGVDYGGPTREWFMQVSEQLTQPELGLFKTTGEDSGVYTINPHSCVNPNHLQFFRFMGRFLAKALFDRNQIAVSISQFIYKILKNERLELEDVKEVDEELYQSARSIEDETDPESLDDMYLCFSVDVEVQCEEELKHWMEWNRRMNGEYFPEVEGEGEEKPFGELDGLDEQKGVCGFLRNSHPESFVWLLETDPLLLSGGVSYQEPHPVLSDSTTLPQVEKPFSFYDIPSPTPTPLPPPFSPQPPWSEIVTVDLVPGGRDIEVTLENRHHYVARLLHFHLVDRINDQLNALSYGFHELIPVEWLKEVSVADLDALISGESVIDVEDWKANTALTGFRMRDYSVQWFWSIIESMDNTDRLKVFQFVTGTNRVPKGGFAFLTGGNAFRKFKINKVMMRPESLPTSHTCFNQLDLPLYRSQKEMEQRLWTAMEWGLTGFYIR